MFDYKNRAAARAGGNCLTGLRLDGRSCQADAADLL